ncbi:MAG: beta-ketoacyl synthase chain length factor [Sphingomonadales bacterium]|jgi:hypothetical protein
MTVSVAVRQWAAWSAGCSNRQEWERWFKGGVQRAPQPPDVSFLPPIQRRRLSLLSKMGLWLANECLSQVEGVQDVASVFSSQYGEYERTFGILKNLAAGEPVSPGAFSQSVHNTSSGLFSILSGNEAASTVVSAGASTLEAGFMEAALQARSVKGRDILYVYQDLPLPTEYETLDDTKCTEDALGLGMLLRTVAPDDKRAWHLSWQTSPDGGKLREYGPARRVKSLVKMLVQGHGRVTFDDGRLLWTWHYG